MGRLNYVVALAAEARPLIDYYRLQQVTQEPFPFYCRDSTTLVVSGIGKVNASAAVMFSAMMSSTGTPSIMTSSKMTSSRGAATKESGARDAAWLNVGIGGHRDQPLGTPLWAHRVLDAGSGQVWFPPLVVSAEIDSPLTTRSVHTVDRPQQDYPEDAVYEMELAALMATAWRWSCAELVHGVKVVSDNLQSSTDAISPQRARQWITDALPPITALGAALLQLSGDKRKRFPVLEEWDSFRQRWHFSVTQQHRLRDLLERARAVGCKDCEPIVAAAERGAEVLAALDGWLARQRVQGVDA